MDDGFRVLLDESVKFHGHLCAGQVLGVKMAVAGLRELGIVDPRGAEGRDLVIFVEIDRCVTDAIIAVTGRTPGKRGIKMVDYGKMAATFVNAGTGGAVRVSVLADSSERVGRIVRMRFPEADERRATVEAMIEMPEEDLLKIQRVRVALRPEDLPGESLDAVTCRACGETIRDMRQVNVEGGPLCRPCARGRDYYTVLNDSRPGGDAADLADPPDRLDREHGEQGIRIEGPPV